MICFNGIGIEKRLYTINTWAKWRKMGLLEIITIYLHVVYRNIELSKIELDYQFCNFFFNSLESLLSVASSLISTDCKRSRACCQQHVTHARTNYSTGSITNSSLKGEDKGSYGHPKACRLQIRKLFAMKWNEKLKIDSLLARIFFWSQRQWFNCNFLTNRKKSSIQCGGPI